ncbi:hypothetical protein TNCT_189351 [Trichonephila clavata]|uniref:Uncharacterized protein n=1 Tax=Trichonephila clavata TaxID=2740835 RepID=A0A8X6H8L3_TRICU|nr:hypothetical protein TNCT_189351 [Trichonephila clavata]
MLLKLIPSDLILDYNKLQQKDSGSDIQQLFSYLTQSLTAREQTYTTTNKSRPEKISDRRELDYLGIKDLSKKRSKLEVQDLALKHFENTVLRDDEGRLFDYEQVLVEWEKEGIIEKLVEYSIRLDSDVLIPKLLIQECWKIETSWNFKLPIDIERKFERWKKQPIDIQETKIPRRFSNLDIQEANLSLQVFCDASNSSRARQSAGQDLRLRFILSSNPPVIKALINYKHVYAKIVPPTGDGEKKSYVHLTNSPLFSEATERSHLPINIYPELSKHQEVATSSMQPCSSVCSGLDWSPEQRQVDTSSRKPLR